MEYEAHINTIIILAPICLSTQTFNIAQLNSQAPTISTLSQLSSKQTTEKSLKKTHTSPRTLTECYLLVCPVPECLHVHVPGSESDGDPVLHGGVLSVNYLHVTSETLVNTRMRKVKILNVGGLC